MEFKRTNLDNHQTPCFWKWKQAVVLENKIYFHCNGNEEKKKNSNRRVTKAKRSFLINCFTWMFQRAEFQYFLPTVFSKFLQKSVYFDIKQVKGLFKLGTQVWIHTFFICVFLTAYGKNLLLQKVYGNIE